MRRWLSPVLFAGHASLTDDSSSQSEPSWLEVPSPSGMYTRGDREEKNIDGRFSLRPLPPCREGRTPGQLRHLKTMSAEDQTTVQISLLTFLDLG